MLCHLYIQLTYKQELSISLQICQALVFLHSAAPPFAHLDLKPANTLVSALIDYRMNVWLVLLYTQSCNFRLKITLCMST